MGTYGSTCSDRSSGDVGGGYTSIPGGNFLNAKSVHMSSCCVWVYAGSGSLKVKLFKKTGTNDFTMVAETGYLSFAAGQNTFSVDLTGNNDTAIDWIVGIYTADAFTIEANSGGEGRYTYAGDVTGSATFNAASGNYTCSISCQMVELIADAYVNSSTGNDNNAATSCANAVKTFAKAYELLQPLGTIYVCNSGADFSGETITFTKSFSITVSGSGNFYMPKIQ